MYCLQLKNVCNNNEVLTLELNKDISCFNVKKLISYYVDDHPKVEDIALCCDLKYLQDDQMISAFKKEGSNEITFQYNDITAFHTVVSEMLAKYDDLSAAEKGMESEKEHSSLNDPIKVVEGEKNDLPEVKPRKRQPFKIIIGLDNIVVAALSFYVIVRSNEFSKWMDFVYQYTWLYIPKILLWILFNILYLLVPAYHRLMNDNQNAKKKDMVDYTMKGFLGDIWLCVYYFFATMLPWNWGPKVFRD